MKAPKFQYFDGLKFTRDDSTGYYLNSTNRIRMHRYVWEYYFGPIPPGKEIHHMDHDKANNNIDNLLPLNRFDHLSYHGAEAGKRNVESGHLDRIRPLASEWHSSKEGKEWHRKHYKRTKEALHAEKDFICEQCGVIFSAVDNGLNRFCSNKCKSKWRRESGLDDEERECTICGQEFTANKYSKSKTCSFSCRSKLNHQNRKSKVN